MLFFGRISRDPLSSSALSFLVRMPAPLGYANLKGVAPSKAELEAAKKILAASQPGSKEHKSKMNSFSSWLKANGKENEEATSSRGDDRQRWLEMFMIHSMRSKAGQKKQVVTQKKIEEGEVKHRETMEWSREQMEKELGANKAAKWIASGLLPKGCCPLTQSWDEDLIVYSVLDLLSI